MRGLTYYASTWLINKATETRKKEESMVLQAKVIVLQATQQPDNYMLETCHHNCHPNRIN